MTTKADYQISSFVNEGILEIILTGEFRSGSLEQIKNKVVAIEKSVNIKSELIDIRKIKGHHSVTEIYYFARSFPPDRPKINTAIVDTAVNADLKSFLETTTLNIGMSFKFFTDIDAAREWLKSK
ncbi:MAG: hypothetical protein ABSF13_10275 [Smithella sp.]